MDPFDRESDRRSSGLIDVRCTDDGWKALNTMSGQPEIALTSMGAVWLR